MEPIVVLFTGGINSTVAACREMDGADLHLLFVRHGQAAVEPEATQAARIAEALAATLHVVELPLEPETTQFGPTKTHPGAEARTARDAGGVRTPGIMLAMLAAAQQLASRIGARRIVSGASQVCNEHDYELRPGSAHADARRVFLHAATIALEMGGTTKRAVSLDAPLADVSRLDIVRIGRRLGAPLHLTWYCHQAGPNPCEKCPGCRSAAEALAAVDTGTATPAAAARQ